MIVMGMPLPVEGEEGELTGAPQEQPEKPEPNPAQKFADELPSRLLNTRNNFNNPKAVRKGSASR